MDMHSIDLYKNVLRDERVSVHNIRVMVVGPWGVGKTTLTKRLLGEPVDITERVSTDGIDVHVHRCKISLKDGTWILPKSVDEAYTQDLRHLKADKENLGTMSLWDFAGQYVFYATHQAFFCRRAVYLLVTNISKHIDNTIDGDPWHTDCRGEAECRIAENTDFWLNSIHEFCSNGRESGPPVILVGTHADLLKKKDISPDDAFSSLREFLVDKVASCHLTTENFLIDNTVEDETIQSLRKHIFDAASKQPYWSEDIPAKWVKLEEVLMTMKEKNLKVLHKDRLKELNKTLPVPIETDMELELFLQFHHEMGNVIYFSKDDLTDYILLDPQWLIDAFKSLLCAREFCARSLNIFKEWREFARKAVLKPALIDAVWEKGGEDNGYNKYRNLLLTYMEHLGLVARPVQQKELSVKDWYFVPCLLRQRPPEEVTSYCDSTHCKSTSKLCYTTAGRFLPATVFNKLLAACLQRWPLSKRNEKYMIFSGGAIFILEDNHFLNIFLYDHVMQIWITRRGGQFPNISLCKETQANVEYIVKTRIRMHSEIIRFVKCPKVSMYSNENMVKLKLSTLEIICYCQDSVHVVPYDDLTKYWSCDQGTIHSRSILPKEILNMGEDSINLYKKALQDGTVSVYNIRVMVVGHYGVGKTTLTKRLFGEQVDIRERASTEGIDVHVDRCKISLKDGTWIPQKPDGNHKKILLLLAKLFEKGDQEVTQPSKEMTAMPDIGDPLHESAKPREQTSSQTDSSLDVDKAQEQKTTVEYPKDSTKTEIKHSKVESESAEIMKIHPQSTNDIEESVVESEEKENTQILRHLQKLIAECGQDDKVQGQTGELSIWDFAGQEVYYSTHQVFLSRRAIYLLVVDMSKDLDDVIEEKDDSNIDCKGEPKDKNADEELTESSDHGELDKFKRYIDKAYSTLKNCMTPGPILDCFLKEDKLFHFPDIRDIQEQTTTTEKNRKILDKVRSKTKDCYNILKNCLIKTNQKLLFEYLECIEKGKDTSALEKQLHDEGVKKTSKGNKEHTKEETNRKTVSDFIDFWLNSIHEFGSYEDEFGSYEDDKRPPVILVGTFADKLKKRKSNPEEYLTNMREVLNKKVASCHLTPKDFPIDNNVDEEYIPALKKHIFEVASGQKSWGEEIPASWVTLEDILIGIKEQKLKKFLRKNELRELNRTLPVPIGDEELELFLRFHHEIGSYLYFSEDGLKESIILKPQWLIDALKCIINANSFCIRQGKEIKDKWSDFKRTAVLKPVIIDAVWGNDENKERGFKENEKLLLSYMEKLGLVAKPKVEDNCSEKVQNYIVPYMLQTTVPKDSISYSDDRDTRKSTSILCYTTAEESNERFLPLQIFNKFLCMCVQKWELHKKTERTKKETTVMIFCGGAVFNLQDGHLLYIFFHEQVIQIWITRTSKDGHKPSFSLCSDTKTQIEKILNTNCRMHTRLLPFVKCSKADLYSTEKEILFELEENSSTKESPCFCQEDENNDHFVLTSCWPHEQED